VLQTTSRKGYKKVVQLLLDNGVEVNAQDGVKGLVRGQAIATTSPWKEKGTLPYTLACTVKSRPGSR
jgi:hypothetical protein